MQPMNNNHNGRPVAVLPSPAAKAPSLQKSISKLKEERDAWVNANKTQEPTVLSMPFASEVIRIAGHLFTVCKQGFTYRATKDSDPERAIEEKHKAYKYFDIIEVDDLRLENAMHGIDPNKVESNETKFDKKIVIAKAISERQKALNPSK